ncbi:hypothetical protein BDZ89DRAFT_1055666 [Hymenopellis radicata]|nr:hypothetical protein BDZ89DRAFT_1055666 [Hymenopellis radicata]
MLALRRLARLKSTLAAAAVDECGVPLRPTWSVNELLSSYPKPTISDDALVRLHQLSALIPPKEGSPEFRKLKAEMEDLVKLVEAVKLVNTDGVQVGQGLETKFSTTATALPETGASGRSLMEHAARTKDGFYVVESDRQR